MKYILGNSVQERLVERVLEWPGVQVAADLAGDVAVDVPHESGKHLSVGGPAEEVSVRPKENRGAELELWVLAFGSPEDADNDLVDRRTGFEEQAALKSAGGDLDEGTALGDPT